MNTSTHPIITFIGGGNMASAIIGGLVRQGHPSAALQVVEPWDEQRAKLAQQFPSMSILPAASAELKPSDLVVWAVKPQTFKDAALAAGPFLGDALHLSVAAGITSESMAGWLQTQRIVRAMPNTPALVGQGMTGLYAHPGASASDRAQVEAVVATTGAHVWLQRESDLDTVTALSGSGPAYVFYFLEAMREAGIHMGLDTATAQKLAIGTFVGASALAAASDEPPEVLRERVTSKGGTTFAALHQAASARAAPHPSMSFRFPLRASTFVLLDNCRLFLSL